MYWRGETVRKDGLAHGEQEALEILKEGLAACGLAEKELKTLPGSDVCKVAIAARIWENTTVSMSWISENLVMKSAANASQQIRRLRGKRGDTKFPKALQIWLKQSRNVA